ncbi:VOC family protein [Cellulomonas sp. NPDC057328]|uniref:VOC family protein n=1 Tax=Cellulomonas sp. NPDC057328 TaxID=3346101 RepID=UPI003629CFC1
MLRGVATISIYAEDHAAASAWYTEVLGIEPYYQVTGYHEWRVGEHEDELGLIDAAWAPPNALGEPGGAVVLWHVDDLEAAHARLLALGATPREPITERGEGFRTAVVVDPFGNLLGVMQNPHWLEVRARRGGTAGPEAVGGA